MPNDAMSVFFLALLHCFSTAASKIHTLCQQLQVGPYDKEGGIPLAGIYGAGPFVPCSYWASRRVLLQGRNQGEQKTADSTFEG